MNGAPPPRLLRFLRREKVQFVYEKDANKDFTEGFEPCVSSAACRSQGGRRGGRGGSEGCEEGGGAVVCGVQWCGCGQRMGAETCAAPDRLFLLHR